MADNPPVILAGGTSATQITTCAFAAQAAGTLLILAYTGDDYITTSGANRPESSGWTQVRSVGSSPGTSYFGTAVWIKKATGSETSVDYKIGAAAKSAWIVLAVPDIDGTTPVNVSAVANANTAATNYTMPSVGTPTGSGRCLTIAFPAASLSSGALSGVSAYTNSYVSLTAQQSSSPADMIAAAYLFGDRGTAVPATNFTLAGSATAQAGGGIVVTLNVATSGGGSTVSATIDDSVGATDALSATRGRAATVSDSVGVGDSLGGGATGGKVYAAVDPTSPAGYGPDGGQSISTGLAFGTSATIQISAIRYWRAGTGNDGSTIQVALYEVGNTTAVATGSRVQTSGDGIGWVEVPLSAPVTINAPAIAGSASHLARAYFPNGYYTAAASQWPLTGQPTQGPLYQANSQANFYDYGSATYPTTGSASTFFIVDAVGLSGANSVAATFNESVGLTDALSGLTGTTRTLDDSVGLTDSLGAAWARSLSVSDPVGLADSTSRSPFPPGSNPYTGFADGASAGLVAQADTGAYVLASALYTTRSDVSLIGIRIFVPAASGAGGSGFIGYLMDSTVNGATPNRILQSRAFPGVGAGTWTTMLFDLPEDLLANHTYWVAVDYPNGRYGFQSDVFPTDLAFNGLAGVFYRASSSLSPGSGNGSYAVGGGGTFPTTAASSNGWYGVDAIVEVPPTSANVAFDDAVGVTDDAAPASTRPVSISDLMSVLDQSAPELIEIEQIQGDPVGISDSLSATQGGGLGNVVNDNVGIGDQLLGGTMRSQTFADSLGLGDALLVEVPHLFAEAEGLSDDLGETWFRAETFGDGLFFSDLLTASGTSGPQIRTVSDGIGIGDSLTAVTSQPHLDDDYVSIGDQMYGERVRLVVLADLVGIADLMSGSSSVFPPGTYIPTGLTARAVPFPRPAAPPSIVYISDGDSEGRAAQIWDADNAAWILTLDPAMVELAWGDCDAPPTSGWGPADEVILPNAADRQPKLTVKRLVSGPVGSNQWLWARITWLPGYADIMRVEGTEVAIR